MLSVPVWPAPRHARVCNGPGACRGAHRYPAWTGPGLALKMLHSLGENPSCEPNCVLIHFHLNLSHIRPNIACKRKWSCCANEKLNKKPAFIAFRRVGFLFGLLQRIGWRDSPIFPEPLSLSLSEGTLVDINTRMPGIRVFLPIRPMGCATISAWFPIESCIPTTDIGARKKNPSELSSVQGYIFQIALARLTKFGDWATLKITQQGFKHLLITYFGGRDRACAPRIFAVLLNSHLVFKGGRVKCPACSKTAQVNSA